MNENPYQAPTTFDVSQSTVTDAETIRATHLKTEASIKSIGILYWLAAVALVFTSLPLIVAGDGAAGDIAIGAALLALGILQFILGFEIRKFKSWARIAVGILSGIGLLGIPIGTLINAYILFLLFGKKGKVVFSAPYKEIMAATPHIKYKTSKAVWIVLFVFILFIGGLLVFAVISK